MQKDYAKRINKYNPPKKRVLSVLILIFGLLLVIGIIFFIYKKQEIAQSAWLNHISTLLKHKSFVNEKAKMVVKAPEPQVHFDFYNELPNMQLTSVQSMEKIPPKIETKKVTSSKFILEINRFNDEAAANQSRVSLLLLGCESEIIKVEAADGKTFQVQSIPYNSQAQAKKMQRKLQAQGIISSIKKT